MTKIKNLGGVETDSFVVGTDTNHFSFVFFVQTIFFGAIYFDAYIEFSMFNQIV